MPEQWESTAEHLAPATGQQPQWESTADHLTDDDLIRQYGGDPNVIKKSAGYQQNLKQHGSGVSFMLTKPGDSIVGDILANATDARAKLGAVVTGGVSDVGHGAFDVVSGMAQLARHGAGALGLMSDADVQYADLLDRVREKDYVQNVRGGNVHPWLRMLGNVLTPVPGGSMVKGAGPAATIARGTLTGAIAAGSQPVEDTRNYWTSKLGQVGTGAATGAVVGSLLAPFTRPAAAASAPLSPVEQATVDWAERENIPTRLSMRTGNQLARDLEGQQSHSVGGAGYAKSQMRATTEALAAKGDVYAGRVSPTAATPETAGSGARGALESDLEQTGQKLSQRVSPRSITPHQAGAGVESDLANQIENLKTNADQNYAKAWAAEKDPANLREVPVRDKDGGLIIDPNTGEPQTIDMPLPIDMRNVKDALVPIYDRYYRVLTPTERHGSKGLLALQNIIEGHDFKPISAAELDLSMLKAAARTEGTIMRDTSQGLAAASLKEMQAEIDRTMQQAHVPGYDPAAGGVNPAFAALQQGRQSTAQAHEIDDLLRKFGPKETREPVGIFGQLTWGRDAGIERLKQVAALAPNRMPEVGRAFIDSGGNWDTLGAETKKILFKDPQLISDLNKYYAWGDKVRPLLSKEPVRVFAHLTQAGDGGIEMLRQIQQKAPGEMPGVGRAYLQGLLDTATREGGFEKTKTVLNQWNRLGDETKTVLFGSPRQIEDLDNFFLYAKRNAEQANPSGSGYMATLSATGMLLATNPKAGAAYILSNAALSRMLYNPAAAKALARVMQSPTGPAIGALLRVAGNNAAPLACTAAKAFTAPARRPLSDFHLPAAGEQPTQQQ